MSWTRVGFRHHMPSPCIADGGALRTPYALVKRLLGLAYFWGGTQNGVALQLQATWLPYAILVDLTDTIAEALNRPFAAISPEMVYRSLFFLSQAYHWSEATDPVPCLAQNADWLGIQKIHHRGCLRR